MFLGIAWNHMFWTLELCCNAGEEAEPSKELAGFEYDQSSGLYYNTSLGCYFDAQKQLYGDASSGQWYSFEDGTYKLASLPVRT